jgi:hypothetical protein
MLIMNAYLYVDLWLIHNIYNVKEIVKMLGIGALNSVFVEKTFINTNLK